MNEELKNKIELLLISTRGMTVNDAIQYIKSIFPKSKFEYEIRSSSTDFYVENKEIIHLSSNNESKIIISYPEGDRLGDRLSNPNIDISFEVFNNYQLELYHIFLNNTCIEQTYQNLYNIIDNITNDIILSKDIVLMYLEDNLFDYPPHLPVSFLEKITDDILIDDDVKSNIINILKEIATHNSFSSAYDQYIYGRFKCENVSCWQMSDSHQFYNIARKLPDHIYNLYKKEIEEIYNQIQKFNILLQNIEEDEELENEAEEDVEGLEI